MNITDYLYKNIKQTYSHIEDITKKRPVAAIIYSVALSALAIFINSFSAVLAIEIFAFSLFFDIAIIKNFQEVCNKIERKIIEVFKSSTEATRAKGKREGIYIRGEIERQKARVKELFKEIKASF